MLLLEKVQRKIAKKFKRLNATGKNFGGRFPVSLETWAAAPAGDNPVKKEPPAVQGTPVALVVIELELGTVRGFDREIGAMGTLGDARLEVARYDADEQPVSSEQLAGQGLDAGQFIRYRIDGRLFVPAGGQVEDRDGTSWRLVLKEET